MKAIASIFMPWVSFSSDRASALAVEDRNDPAELSNPMGRVCEVHGCNRELDEAPMVTGRTSLGDFSRTKRQLFPNSWTAVATINPPSRGGWLSRSRRKKMIVVRYCEECRLAAEQWMREQGEL